MNTDRFKAKALTVGDNPEWVWGYYRPPAHAGYAYGRIENRDGLRKIDVSTLCQCTGLKGSQGKLGFDGDHFLNEHGEEFRLMWYIDGWVAVRIPRRTMVRMRDIEFSKCTLTGKNIHDPNQ